jgi:superoxide dismutase
MQQYTLPDLSYDYGALEPYYSGEMLELHHDKHHAAYVTGANATLVAQGAEPLLVIDAWEHAYYLQYRNDRAQYVDTIWNVINWPDVAGRFSHVCHGH